jgi:AraC-like DNA-binding protein
MTPVPISADALRQFRLFQSNDLDDTRERISRVMQPHTLDPLGNVRGSSHMDFVQLGGTGVGLIGFGDSMQVDVDAVDGYHLLMFCVAGHADVEVDRQPHRVDDAHGVLCRPGQRFRARLSQGCEQLVVRIRSKDFAARLTDASASSGFYIGSNRWTAWLQHLQWITSSPDLLRAAQSSARVATGVEYLLLELLAYARADDMLTRRAPSVAPSVVSHAIDFMHARFDEPLRVQDIADAVDVPERTLRDAFQRFKGASPMQFLHQIRLERAYDLLNQIDNARSVSDVALDCGFTHLGRFSVVYREKFGESPSDTYRRIKRLRTV